VPQALLNQLAAGGRMIIPVGKQRGTQYLMQIDKDAGGQITQKKLFSVAYVPLVKK